MRILILTNYSSVYGGNFIPSIVAFAQYCIQKCDEVGFAFDIKAKDRIWCKQIQNDYPTYFVQNQGYINDSISINKYINDNKYDCVYSHFSYFYIACILSLINPRLAIICHKHTDIGCKNTAIRQFRLIIKKYLFYRNMSLIFVSKRLQKFEHMENMPNSYFLQNALVTTRFNKEDRYLERKKLREEYRIPSSAIVILMFGWHFQVKGVDIALSAFKELGEKYPDSYLLIVTNSVQGDMSTQNIARKYIKGDMRNVIFLPPIQNVEKYHFASDIFLSSSRSEGFSYSILEALFLGELLVISDLDSCRWAEKYNTAFFFQSENICSCAETLEKSINLIGLNQADCILTSSQVEKDFNILDWVKSVYCIVTRQCKKKEKANGVRQKN